MIKKKESISIKLSINIFKNTLHNTIVITIFSFRTFSSSFSNELFFSCNVTISSFFNFNSFKQLLIFKNIYKFY